MRAQQRVTRACTALTALTLAGACGVHPTEPRPVAALASSPQSAAAFEAIRQAWGDPERVSTAVLREMIEHFLARFRDDGLVPTARVALAIVAMQTQDFAVADVELARTQELAPGSARDLWTVASARALRLRDHAEAALTLLRPLVGKTVDPLARSLFEEELTLAALATHREYEAISYMDAWLRATSEEDKPRVAKRVAVMVEQLPKDVLVGALEAMRAQRASFGYGVEIERILSERLVRIATTSGDAALARLLLDADPGAVAISGNASAALGELATSRRGLNVVLGRTIGLLLPTASPDLRDESADVLRGVTWALGLPRGVRKPPSPAAPIAGDSAARAAANPVCALPEKAPELDEPRAAEGVRLVTRDDGGAADSAGSAEASLDELAGEGAAVIIAGLDALTATRALRWAERHAVPLIALVVPPDKDLAAAFGFSLGVSRDDVVRTLVKGAPEFATEPVTPVLDSSEVALYPPLGGPFAGLTFAPPSSCDTPAVAAGEPRFPIPQWIRDRRRAWLVTGSPSCARDVVTELSGARRTGVVALTLEASALAPHAAGLRVVTAEAGIVPVVAPSDPRADEALRFSSALGAAGWWAALGRDAATLARLAVRQLPPNDASDPQTVAARRSTARDQLAAAAAPLWTTEKNGWAGGRIMERTICALPVPEK